MAGSAAKNSFSTFLSRVLEPLPDHELVDTALNRAERDTRATAWSDARFTTDYWFAEMQCAWATATYAKRVINDSDKEKASIDDAVKFTREWRQAVGRQLLTPAPSKVDVAWKRRHADDKFLSVSRNEIQAAIASDEAFLSAHPIRRTRQ